MHFPCTVPSHSRPSSDCRRAVFGTVRLFWTLLAVQAALSPSEPCYGTLCVSAAQPPGGYRLRQLHVIARHGSRMPLTKESEQLLENDGVPLTHLGIVQQYRLGRTIREVYAAPSSGSNGDDFIGTYSPFEHRLESSHLDRTLVSANAMAMGLFGRNKRLSANATADGMVLDDLWASEVPVYCTEEQNDVTIRAYKNCPAFSQTLRDLYASNEWLQMERDNIPTLSKYAPFYPQYSKLVTVVGDGDSAVSTSIIALDNLWNVYDDINVVRTECNILTRVCNGELSVPDYIANLTEDEWLQLSEITHNAEYLKYYHNPDAPRLIGNNLVHQIVDRIRSNKGKYYHYSAHYPTILGVMATLRLSVPTLTTIPDYASAFVVEVFTPQLGRTSDALLRFSMLSGDEQKIFDHTCGTEFCSLDDLAFDEPEEWCRQCQNTHSDICLAHLLTQQQNGDSAVDSGNSSTNGDNGETSSSSNNNNNGLSVLGSFLLGFFVGILAVLITYRACARDSVSAENDTAMIDNSATSASDGEKDDVETDSKGVMS